MYVRILYLAANDWYYANMWLTLIFVENVTKRGGRRGGLGNNQNGSGQMVNYLVWAKAGLIGPTHKQFYFLFFSLIILNVIYNNLKYHINTKSKNF